MLSASRKALCATTRTSSRQYNRQKGGRLLARRPFRLRPESCSNSCRRLTAPRRPVRAETSWYIRRRQEGKSACRGEAEMAAEAEPRRSSYLESVSVAAFLFRWPREDIAPLRPAEACQIAAESARRLAEASCDGASAEKRRMAHRVLFLQPSRKSFVEGKLVSRGIFFAPSVSIRAILHHPGFLPSETRMPPPARAAKGMPCTFLRCLHSSVECACAHQNEPVAPA